MIDPVFVDIIVASIAFFALLVSLSSHMVSSFQTLFTAMTNMLRAQLSGTRINSTELIKGRKLMFIDGSDDCEFAICREHSIYRSFADYYSSNVSRLRTQSMNGHLSAEIWENFVRELEYRSELEQVFKYIYDCVEMVDKSFLSPRAKRRYVRLISDMLTTEQLFCYMMNQAHFCSGYCKKDKTIKMLKKYNFFRDLYGSPLYKTLERRFDAEFIRCFSKSK